MFLQFTGISVIADEDTFLRNRNSAQIRYLCTIPIQKEMYICASFSSTNAFQLIR